MSVIGMKESIASLPQGVLSLLGPERKVCVTGCAGFIGSHLVEALLALGCQVTGVDALTDYYDPRRKRENLRGFGDQARFTFCEADLLDLDPVELLAGSSVCFHLAAQAGVRASWGLQFSEYLARNVQTTQRLLEACRSDEVRPRLGRFVYASSSSIYGDGQDLPVTESALPRPHSPYGVTKLAAEHLCSLYGRNWGVPVTSLRYFTVYGPRQRPDMAFTKFIEAALNGRPFTVFGDGRQTRDFTFVGDAVRATILAAQPLPACEVLNIGGGARISLQDVLAQLSGIIAARVPGAEPVIEYREVVAGDVRDTYADRARAESVLQFHPTVNLQQGLERQVQWALARRESRV
jgi:nucleoside-diphosphate-sugar epimerase